MEKEIYNKHPASKYVMILVVLFVLLIISAYISSKFLGNSDKTDKPEATNNIALSSNLNLVAETNTGAVKKINSGVSGVVMIGPSCPVQKEQDEKKCADKPYETTLKFTGIKKAYTTSSFGDGKFSIDLPPGEYVLSQAMETVIPRLSSPKTVVVTDNKYTEIKVELDSGIR